MFLAVMFYNDMVQDTSSDYANCIVSSSSDVAFPIGNGPTDPRDQNRDMYLFTLGDRDIRQTASSPNSSQTINSVTHHDSLEQSSTHSESGTCPTCFDVSCPRTYVCSQYN